MTKNNKFFAPSYPPTELVYKSNALVEAAYRLTVAEQRTVLLAISQVRHNEMVTDEVMYSISAESYARLSGIDTAMAYVELKEAALRLKHRDVRIIREPNNGKARPKVLITSWAQSIQYVEFEGRVELRFSKDMLPYITELTQQFTKYHLAATAKMSSTYAIRLYELLVQWREAGEREVAIDWLRGVFLLNDKYPSIRDFKRWVIEPAVVQINEHSDLQVAWSQRKTGRRVTHLIFTFQEKRTRQPRKRRQGGERICGVLKADIERLARPGETYEQAAVRIHAEQSH